MLCQRLYRIVLSVYLRRLGPDPSASEPLVRALWQTNQYTPSTGRVKPKAFEVNRADLTVSVARVIGLSERTIWRWIDTFVARNNEDILFRADLLVQEVRNVGLRVEPREPPVRHANITGWSAAKAEQKSRAQQLAAVARLVQR